jgi:hypothetical protein
MKKRNLMGHGKCGRCGYKFKSWAEKCPKCGTPTGIRSDGKTKFNIRLIGIIGGTIFMVFFLGLVVGFVYLVNKIVPDPYHMPTAVGMVLLSLFITYKVKVLKPFIPKGKK